MFCVLGGMKGGAKVTIEPHRHEGKRRYFLASVCFIDLVVMY